MKRNWLPSLATGVLVLLFFVKVLSSHQWNPRAFVLERPPGLPAGQRWGVGYDGQFSYLLAVNALGSVQGLDQPAFRYQRIVYPIIIRVLGLSQPMLVPWMMMAVNLLAAVAACFALGELLARRGVPRGLAMVFVLSFGYLLAIRLDLLEPLTYTLALLGWLAYETDRPRLAILLFALAGLTKEVGLLFPAALAAWELFRRRGRRAAAILAGSIVPYAVWYFILRLTLGGSPLAALQSSPVPIPFAGIFYMSDPVQIVFVSILVLLPAFIGGTCAAWFALRDRVGERSRDAFLVMTNAALVAVMPLPTWEDPLAIARIGLGVLGALLLWLAGSHRRALPFAFALWAPSGLILAFVPGML